MTYVPVTLESSHRFVDLISGKDRWKLVELSERSHIEATYIFSDFIAAFGFMTQIAMKAEKMNHHPNWSNVYNKVTIVLYTHETDGITEHDLELAEFCDSVYD